MGEQLALLWVGQPPPKMRPFRPSNGTAGMEFEQRWCERCRWEDGCSILPLTLVLEVGDPGYPPEWVCGEKWPRKGAPQPQCTAFEPRGRASE